jgi:serine/threonine protein kinase
MEYAKNGNVLEQIRKVIKYNEKDAFNVFSQACLGIDFLHKNSIIHRDLKPENLLVSENKKIKIADFGWSIVNGSQKKDHLVGTLEYMAPEIILGQTHGFGVDIWALGVLLFE